MTTAAAEAPIARATSLGARPFSPATVDRAREEASAPVGPKMRTRDLTVRYGTRVGIEGVSIDVHPREVLALIGPSGCGKSTFLRCLNRMNDAIEGAVVSGRIELEGHDIHGPGIDPVLVRRHVGMVFQKSNPFPKSIFDNVAYGLRVAGLRDKHEIAARVEQALEQAALLHEVKDRLKESGLALSGGQQQRLCIARALAVKPTVLLMDEPASALDPIATAKLEELVKALRDTVTIVIVTHNLQQAVRVSQRAAFFHFGKLVEVGETAELFERPREKQTLEYVTGRFG